MRLPSTTGVLLPLAAVAAISASCGSALDAIRSNSESIDNSSRTIAANTVAVGETTHQMRSLSGDFEGLEELRQALQDAAGLRDSLTETAKLAEPLSRLGDLAANLDLESLDLGVIERLEPWLKDAAALSDPLERVALLEATLARVAALEDELSAVAALGPRLAEVAELQRALEQVAALEPALAEVAALGESLQQVGGLGSLLTPARLVVPLLLLGVVILVATAAGVHLGTLALRRK